MRMDSCTPIRPSFSYTHTQVLDLAPDILAHNRIIMGLPHEPHADIFRTLRTQILNQLRDNNWNSMAITSVCPGVGKTLITANLAIAMALEGKQTVLLVDMDFRHPRLARYLGIPPAPGLTDYLAGRVPFEQILFNPGIDRLVVVPGGREQANASEWVASPRMADLITEIRSRYESRIILFDIPPLFQADDAQMIIPMLDGVLLVVEDGKHTPDELRHALYLLSNTNLLGLVLNRAIEV